MKNQVTEQGPVRPERSARPVWLRLLVGLGFGVAVLALGFSQEAGAQEADLDPAAEARPSASKGIEEIVVRGAESEATRDFAAADSVTGFGAEDLAALGAQSIADLAAFTPNLEIVTYSATSPTFFIRGVGLNDFNSNSTGAVAIYQDDVMRNAPALQLSTLFDVEAVNVLRGPQGTGSARNASAGAIKIYSRKPTGEFSAFLRSDFGNLDFRDFEGAVEAPIFEDILAARVAFRVTTRDGTIKNRCGNATPFADRTRVPPVVGPNSLKSMGLLNTDPPWSMCGEPVTNITITGLPHGISPVAEGLPSSLNDTDNWAARGTILFQPTLDMSWLLNAHGSRRDELSRVGQAIGTRGSHCVGDLFDDPSLTQAICEFPLPMVTPTVVGLLGGTQSLASPGYRAPEIRQRLRELSPDCYPGVPGFPEGERCLAEQFRAEHNAAKIQLARELARNLDSKPWVGDFNICSATKDFTNSFFLYRDPTGTRCKKDVGRTTNDTWGAYLKGDIVLPLGMELTTVTAYDHYDREIDLDLDFSPETLFHINTDDEGWQFVEDLRLQGQLGDEAQIRWDVGAWFLYEHLDVVVTNDLGRFSQLAVGERDYTQDLYSAAGYLSLAFDFWDDFTLDGGVRYNWEQKKLDYVLMGVQCPTPCVEKPNETWSAPTGTIRLTYRMREDTHLFWKYTRGWKPGTYNATSSVDQGVSIAGPETIDAFETGLRGSWFEGRLGLDFSLFYYSYQDYQLFTAQQFAGGQPEFVILNADDAEVYGAEVDAVARPWSGAFLNVRFGWLESQFLDFVQLQQEIISEPGVGQITVNRSLQNTGNSLLNSPEFKVSLTAEQRIPLWGWGSLTLRYDGVWTDETFFDATEGHGIPNNDDVEFLPDGTTSQLAFWLHNLRVSYRPPGAGRFEIAGWVRNLEDTSYKTFAFDASTFNKTSIYFVGDPRTYGVSMVINF